MKRLYITANAPRQGGGYGGIFIITALVIFGVYLYTCAPTLSFWDCGEFVACGYSLGVPHPPGTPLEVLVCKVFAMIPFGKEIGFRINLISVFCGVLRVMLVWLIIVEIIKRIKPLTTKKDEILAGIGGAVGAFIVAFSYTVWWNSVEIETYAPATLLFILCIWLTLKWDDNIKNNARDQILLLIIYVVALSFGIQLIALLAIPGIFVYMILRERQEFKTYRLLYVIAIIIPFFALCATLPLSMVVVLSVGVLIFIFYPRKDFKKEYKLYGLIVLLIALGFSTFGYLTIRAHQNPRINEAAPTDMQKLWDVFTRKQYGPDKALAMFQRETATKENKYNIFQAFGYQIKFFTDYLTWQWVPYPRQERWEGESISRIIKLSSVILNSIFICLGLFGIYTHYRKERNTFWLMFITFIMVTLIFFVYMNFKFSPSDPNPLHRPTEVRERHYFFEPAFVLFGLYIGLGIWSLLEKVKKGWQLVTPVAIVISLFPLFGNFKSHTNRHGNWIPDDYGYNLLSSCEDNSVLFTNGDNDTFPLWAVQIVKNIKPTVNIANLSLLNTDWYLRQLKTWGAPISLTDYQIDNLMVTPVVKNGEAVKDKLLYVKDIGARDILATNGGYKFEPKLFLPIKRTSLPKKYREHFPKDMEVIPPSYYVRRLPQEYWMRLPEEYLLPAQEFADLVLKDYEPKAPVYFAVTVSRDNFEGFESALRMEALVYKIVSLGSGGFDTEISDSLLNKVYKYRSLFDDKVYKSENDKKLLVNYAASFFALGMAHRDQGNYEKSIQALEFGEKLGAEEGMPFSYQLAALYEMNGNYEKAADNLSKLSKSAKTEQEWYAIGELYSRAGNTEKASEAYNKIVELNPDDPSYAYAGLIKNYLGKGDSLKVKKLASEIVKSPAVTGKVVSLLKFERQNGLVKLILQEWLSIHPTDTVAKHLLDEL